MLAAITEQKTGVEVVAHRNLSPWSSSIGVITVTLVEEDLLSALKELVEVSLAMTNGKLFSASDLERFHRAIEWSNRVISLAERSE